MISIETSDAGHITLGGTRRVVRIEDGGVGQAEEAWSFTLDEAGQAEALYDLITLGYKQKRPPWPLALSGAGLLVDEPFDTLNVYATEDTINFVLPGPHRHPSRLLERVQGQDAETLALLLVVTGGQW